MVEVLRTWRYLKDAIIDGAPGSRSLRLTWALEQIIRVPGRPVIGGGDRGTEDKRVDGGVEIEWVPFNAKLFDAHDVRTREGGKLLTEDEVRELLL